MMKELIDVGRSTTIEADDDWWWWSAILEMIADDDTNQSVARMCGVTRRASRQVQWVKGWLVSSLVIEMEKERKKETRISVNPKSKVFSREGAAGSGRKSSVCGADGYHEGGCAGHLYSRERERRERQKIRAITRAVTWAVSCWPKE